MFSAKDCKIHYTFHFDTGLNYSLGKKHFFFSGYPPSCPGRSQVFNQCQSTPAVYRYGGQNTIGLIFRVNPIYVWQRIEQQVSINFIVCQEDPFTRLCISTDFQVRKNGFDFLPGEKLLSG